MLVNCVVLVKRAWEKRSMKCNKRSFTSADVTLKKMKYLSCSSRGGRGSAAAVILFCGGLCYVGTYGRINAFDKRGLCLGHM